jgi:hypothetical protein
MKRLEDTLKRALRREQPPDGFAERVVARLAAPPSRPQPRARLRWPVLRWAVAAALPLLLFLGYHYQAERRRRAEGERVKAQMLTGLRITADKLESARVKVLRVTSRGAETKPANSI